MTVVEGLTFYDSFHTQQVIKCYILTLDRAVNQRCTFVYKRKKKRKQVVVIKEYRQMTAAVKSFSTGRPASLQTENASAEQP